MRVTRCSLRHCIWLGFPEAQRSSNRIEATAHWPGLLWIWVSRVQVPLATPKPTSSLMGTMFPWQLPGASTNWRDGRVGMLGSSHPGRELMSRRLGTSLPGEPLALTWKPSEDWRMRWVCRQGLYGGLSRDVQRGEPGRRPLEWLGRRPKRRWIASCGVTTLTTCRPIQDLSARRETCEPMLPGHKLPLQPSSPRSPECRVSLPPLEGRGPHRDGRRRWNQQRSGFG